MKRQNNLQTLLRNAALLLPIVLAGCSDEIFRFNQERPDDGLRLELQASIDQVNDTRADESGFADGDRLGLFVVNYSGNQPGTLTISDNQVNNVAVAYNADSNTWQAATDIYWRDKVTPADIYGYYPFNNGLADVDSYSFEVKADQSIAAKDGDMGAYEASDLLWAKNAHAAPGKKVELTFSHVMAGVKVILQQGEGFEGDAWSKLEKTVTVDNTVRTSEVDLSTGTVTPSGSFDRNIVMNPEEDAWRAVVIPQTVGGGKTVIGITIDGKPYAYTRADGMKYTSGKLHTFTIRIDRKGDGGDYALTLINEDITPWESDKSSHDFESNSYLAVHVAEGGTLKKCLEDMRVDAGSIKNLKITGILFDEDFEFIRNNLKILVSINLKDCKVFDYNLNENALTPVALGGMVSLRRVILPESLRVIGENSFMNLQLVSTIIIPESVTIIGRGAFWNTSGSCTVELPNNIERIEDEAFAYSSVNINLKLPNTLKYIGYRAFAGCRNVHGTFALPSNLEYLGQEAFDGCGTDLEGNIIIPEGIKVINRSTFNSMGFKKPISLKLHDGVTQICSNAFSGLKFSAPIVFPKGLTSIGSEAFVFCQFVGDVILPEALSDIGKEAFSNTNMKGTISLPSAMNVLGGSNSSAMGGGGRGPFSQTNIERLEIGDNIEAIISDASTDCQFLRYIKIGKNVSYIGKNAFSGCPAIESIVCLASEPPKLDTSAFVHVDLNHCVVEVPESSVEAYRRAEGWRDFRNITPHHELSLSSSEISCLNKEFFRSIIVRSEGPWQVSECPEWVHVSPDHAEYKEEITVSVDALALGNGNREGQVVFRLKESGYTNYLTISQYDYEFEEDKEIIIQKASGNGNAIPIFIVGEGYGAESIVDGGYINSVNDMMDHFFEIEPYKTYKDMFTVSTAITLSPDDGAKDIQTHRESRFGMIFPEIYDGDAENLKSYAKEVSENIDEINIDKTLIIVLSNYDAFSGSSYHDPYGDCVIACVGNSNGEYPYDNRGLIQCIVGGEAFGGLANEQINHFEFIKGCTCPACNALNAYNEMKGRGLFENVTISGKAEDAPWREFIYHPKYNMIVDMYEGGLSHLRGVWRSESQSVMNSYIPYYNTISRYSIYKQIMKRAGLNPTIEDFVNKDKIEIPN